MSLTASWIAKRTTDSQAVLSTLGLAETGKIDFIGESDLGLAIVREWVVVVSRDLHFASPDNLAELSRAADVVGCQMYESILQSAAFGYRDGQCLWSVVHAPAAGPRDLTVEGMPPPEFKAVRDTFVGEQADHEGESVDYIFEIPLALSKALCGFSLDGSVLPPETVFKVLERVRSGKSGERQASARVVYERLNGAVRDELFPEAARLGYEPVMKHPELHQFYPLGATNAFVRMRGDTSESLQFVWDFHDEVPRVAIHFFVREGAEPHYRRSGSAYAPSKPMTLVERFMGRKQSPDAGIGKAIEDGRELLAAVDRHLREGASHPYVHPARQMDERSEGSP